MTTTTTTTNEDAENTHDKYMCLAVTIEQSTTTTVDSPPQRRDATVTRDESTTIVTDADRTHAAGPVDNAYVDASGHKDEYDFKDLDFKQATQFQICLHDANDSGTVVTVIEHTNMGLASFINTAAAIPDDGVTAIQDTILWVALSSTAPL